MKVLLINGSPHEKGCTYTALSEVAAKLHAEGVESEIFWIGKGPVYGCTACLACRSNGGRCVFDDAANAIIDKMAQCDGMVLGSPVYFASANGALCAVMDRVFYAASKQMRGKVGASVVSCRRGGASAAFDRLNKYITYAGMTLAGSSYWNSVHGNTPEEVLRDEEGLQTMRNLAANIAWLLRAKQAGGEAAPQFEAGVRTNFIR